MASEPDLEKCLLLCCDCFEQVSEPRRFKAGEQWRFLAQVLWSELPAVQVVAVRMLKRQQDSQQWASSALEQVWLEPEVEAWAGQDD
ncbi:MAG: hypothetical protein QM496_14755 [Verrucomicrobiota bacterium]